MTRRIHVFPSAPLDLAREIFDRGVTPDDTTLRRHPELSLSAFLDAAQLARALKTRGRA